MVQELGSIDLGMHSANEVAFDRSGTVLAVASDDGTIKCCDATSRSDVKLIHTLTTGEEGAAPVQCVLFDPQSRYLVSGSSDSAFRIWL